MQFKNISKQVDKLSDLQGRVMRLLHEECVPIGEAARITRLSVHRLQQEETAALRNLVDLLSNRSPRGGRAQHPENKSTETSAGPS